MSFDHTAEAIFFAGVAFWIVRWIIRTEKELIDADNERRSDMHKAVLEPQAAVRQSVRSHALHGEGELPHSGQPLTPPIAVHCPSCGTSLAPEPLPFVRECPGCHRRVTVRGDGPSRISVVVIDLQDH